MKWLLALLWVCSGCEQTPTSVAVSLSLGEMESTPLALTVSVFDRHGALILAHALPSNHLPGTLIVSGLPDLAQPLRIVAAGDSRLLGGTATTTNPHHQVSVQIVLRATTADGDGDGVPDPLDDCPAVADPQQLDGDGDGIGDACASPSDGGVDGSVVDFAAAGDLSVIGCPTDVAFCEDFETGIANPSRWTTTELTAAVRVSTTRPHRGTYALHVHSNFADAGTRITGEILETKTFASGRPPFIAVRLYLWLPDVPPSFTLVRTAEQVSPYDDLELNVDNGVLGLWNGVVNQFTSGKLVPFMQWLCVEWQISTTPGEMRVFVDGSELTQLHVMQSTSPVSGPLAELAFGIDVYQPPQPINPYDVWIDDIIVDTKPVGCAR